MIGAGTASAAPGDHIRYGDLEFVPAIDLGLEYRTNVYRSQDLPVPAADFRVAPGANLMAEGDDHEFRFGGVWELRKYFFVADDRLNQTLPSSERIANLDRFDEFSVAAAANLFKRNVVGFRLADEVAQRNWTADTEIADTPYTSQFRNSFASGLRLNPGPALEIVPGFTWTYDMFQAPVIDEEAATRPNVLGADRSLNSRNSYGPRLDTKYAFLPRTSLVASAAWVHNAWENNTVTGADPADPRLTTPNSDHIKAQGGIDGRFTEKVFAQVLVGYGVGLYDEASVPTPTDPSALAVDATGLSGLLVKAQIRYQITPGDGDEAGSSLTGGYAKDFRDSFFTSYTDVNEGFASFVGRVGDLRPTARYSARFENYHGEITRNDLVHSASGDVRYDAREWAALTAGVGWISRTSEEPEAEYDDVHVRLLATFVY